MSPSPFRVKIISNNPVICANEVLSWPCPLTLYDGPFVEAWMNPNTMQTLVLLDHCSDNSAGVF